MSRQDAELASDIGTGKVIARVGFLSSASFSGKHTV